MDTVKKQNASLVTSPKYLDAKFQFKISENQRTFELFIWSKIISN